MPSPELVLRTVGITVLVILTVVLTRSKARDLKITAAAWLSASVAAFLLTSAQGSAERLGVFLYPLTALCSTHPVWFWLFCLALFSDNPRLRMGHLACLISMAMGGLVYQSLYDVGEASTGERVFAALFSAAWLAFACLAPFTVFLGIKEDLDLRRRRIRCWVVPAVSLYLVAVVVTQSVRLLRGEATPDVLVLGNLLIVDVAAAVALSTFLRIRIDNWLDVIDRSPAIGLTRLERLVLDQLNRRFAAERLYARESLSIADLAATLGTQEHLLRRVINHGMGYRNFNDFLHFHRLREASGRLRDPSARSIPVLTIALEAGYGSIGPFNRAFKERFGVTPTEYRRAPIAEIEISKNPRAFG